MIIGIAGKINSGKDLIGSIIQYLWDQSKVGEGGKLTFDEFLKSPYSKPEYGQWHIKKFAAKIKEILSLLTGIPVEDFEKEEVKNSYLSKEWDNKVDLKGNTYDRVTVRQALQQIGTELFRDKFHSNCWVNALFSEYKDLTNEVFTSYEEEKKYYRDSLKHIAKECLECEETFLTTTIYKTVCSRCNAKSISSHWIITDLRFENEAQAILDREGILIRVNRPLIKKYNKFWIDKSQISVHPSETSLDEYDKFHYIIDNNGSIKDLIEKVKEILIKEKLL